MGFALRDSGACVCGPTIRSSSRATAVTRWILEWENASNVASSTGDLRPLADWMVIFSVGELLWNLLRTSASPGHTTTGLDEIVVTLHLPALGAALTVFCSRTCSLHCCQG